MESQLTTVITRNTGRRDVAWISPQCRRRCRCRCRRGIEGRQLGFDSGLDSSCGGATRCRVARIRWGKARTRQSPAVTAPAGISAGRSGDCEENSRGGDGGGGWGEEVRTGLFWSRSRRSRTDDLANSVNVLSLFLRK